MRLYSVSAMTTLHWGRDRVTGERRQRLDMAQITRFPEFADFDGLMTYVLDDLRYPAEQVDKYVSYAWVPALYGWSANPDREGEEGSWRRGEHESSDLSCHYADLDNKRDEGRHITEAEIASRLTTELDHPVRFFTYTSFTSSSERRKFRAVFDTSRAVSRWEMRRIHLWMQERIFHQQGDDAIYDGEDMIFAPPQRCEITRWEGQPLDVANILARAAFLEADPAVRARYGELLGEKRVREPLRPATPEETAAMRARLADRTARLAFTGIDDPLVCNPDWLTEIDCAASHYQTMLSVLGKVWRKNGGNLSRGEMDVVWDQIDARWGGYMRRHYGRDKPNEMISFVMSCAVIDNTPEPVRQKRALAQAFRAMKKSR